MKLHLPVALLRAVMALFASQVALTSVWAEETEATNPHAVTDNTVYLYGSGDENWKDAWREEWNADEIIITSGNQQKHDVTFKSDGAVTAYDSVMEASKVTISNLGNVTIDGFQGNSSNTAIISAVEYNVINNDSFNYINNNGTVLTEPGNDYSIMTFDKNGEINISNNYRKGEGNFTLSTAIEDIHGVVIKNTAGDITMSGNMVVSPQEWVSGAVVRIEGGLDFIGNQGNIDVSNNTSKIIDGASGDAHGGAILAFGVKISQTGGNISFNNNTASTQGSDYAGGGAISSTGTEEIEVDGVLVGVNLLGNITLSDNLGNIEFNRNKVQSGSKDAYDTDMLQVAAGGAMVAQGKVEISGNKGSLIGFNSNSVEAEVNSAGGGAIAVIGAVEIAENKADVEALTAEDENAGNKLEFKNNSVSSLSDSVCGGAIYSSNDELISVAQDKLGIDYATAESLVNQLVPTYVSIDNNDDVSFIDNSVTSGEVDADGKAVRYGDFADGGAIYSEGKVSLSNNADVEFSGNNATSIGSDVRGGAVYSEDAVAISGNAAVTFDGNQATAYQVEYKDEHNTYYQCGSAYGGAIYMYSYPEVAGVSITGNSGLVSFTDNMAYSERGSAYGGAIYCYGDVTLQGNLAGVSFIGNKVVTGIVDENGNVLVPGSSGYGGAIYARYGVTIMGNSGNITFNDNKAIATESSANGGAIYSDVSVSIKENTGDITFNNNVIESCYWAEGAAIYADEIVEIVGIGYADGKTPGDVTFKENSISVSDSGGRGAAIYGEHGVNLSHNGDILFEDNRVDAQNGTARGAGISTCASEPETQEVAVSILSNGNVTFNNNDTSAFHNSSHGGAIHSYWGAVDIRGNKDVTFTNNDIVSRDNSESGGGAIYSEFGASIVGNGNVTISSNTASSQGGNVYGGAINTDRGSIVINENEAVTISNNRVTAVGSFMKEVVDVDAEGNEVIVGTERAASQITAGGALASNKNVEICSNNGDILFSQNSVTETKVDEVLPSDGWDGSGENPQLPHMAGSGAIGAGESLKMTDNAGNISFSENSVSSECKGVYGGATATIGGFVNISNNTAGIESAGTLTVDGGEPLQLGAVNFSQNKATATGSKCSAHGGAIATFTDYYGGGQVFITGNDTVTFYYNSATSTSEEGAAYGGAIYAANVVDLRGNGDVAFVGNKAEARDSDGGAIFSQKGVSITNNGAVTFSGNVSYANGGAIHVGSYEDTPDAYVNISNNTGLVSFVDNKVTSDTICVHGAAINSFGKPASVTLSGNTAGIQFIGNMGSAEQNSSVIGGGIFCQGGIKFTDNGDILFKYNSVSSKGGDAFGSAMCNSVGNIILDNNGSVQFIGNTTSTLGGFRNEKGEWKTAGAVSGAVTTSNAVSISGNKGAVVFKENTVKETTTDKLLPSGGFPGKSEYPITSGGAVSAALGINIDNNQSVNISGNSVVSETRYALGGALATFGGVSVSGNGDVTFGYVEESDGVKHSLGNTLTSTVDYAFGGAIYGQYGVVLNNNASVSFTANAIDANNRGRGAGIYSDGAVELNYNGAITFTGNTIITHESGSAVGGAISSNFAQTSTTPIEGASVSLIGNKGEITFSGNTTEADEWTAHGGAIYSAGKLTVQDNEKDILFASNSASTKIGSDVAGGAIMTVDKTLFIGNKGNITFDSNTVTTHGGNAGGGAIIGYGTGVSFTDNAGAIVFTDNAVNAEAAYSFTDEYGSFVYSNSKLIIGGAVASFSTVDITGNQTVSFEGNRVTDTIHSGYIDYTNADTIDFGGAYAYTAGGAIASLGNVTITDNAGVLFSSNTVTSSRQNANAVAGGAIASFGTVLISGDAVFKDNSVDSGNGNVSLTYGGAIHAEGAVTLTGGKEEATLEFSGNSVTASSNGMGGAVSSGKGSDRDIRDVVYSPMEFNGYAVTVSGYSSVKFSGNSIDSLYRSRGGAIYADGEIRLSGNGSILFDGNNVTSHSNGSAVGGAISSYLIRSSLASTETLEDAPINIYIENNTGSITFRNNSATGLEYSTNGGAIYGGKDVYITGNSGEILFEGNKVGTEGKISTADGEIIQQGAGDATGGAIVTTRDLNISKNTGDIIFRGNEVDVHGGNGGGGAICTHEFGNTSIVDNKDVTFEGNKVSGYGRYYVEDVAVTDKTLGGGAIASMGQGDAVDISGNGQVTFSGNSVLDETVSAGIDKHLYDEASSTDGTAVTGGGAIMATGNVVIDGNAGVDIKDNYVESGAFLSGQADGRMVAGGAIASYGEVSISHNKGDVNISDNHVGSEAGVATGGAIFTAGGLSIVNNEGNVTFSGNYVKNGDTYHLNSVVVAGGNVELAAAEGKSISFYDSVLVGSGSDMVLNSYSGQTTTGAIVFSGANVEETLQQLKGEGGTVSAEEISASLTSHINREVSVAGGSLQVKDGAVLYMESLGVKSGAELLIGAGSTVGVGSTVTFDAGSEYTVQGLKAATTMSTAEAASSTPTAQIIGDVVLAAGMTYTMDGAYTALVGTNDTLTLDKAGGYTFNVDESLAYTVGNTKYFALFTGVEHLAGVDPSALTGIEFLTNIGYYDEIMLNYTKEYGGVLYISATVPEPTTATLSLLALAALAARRRRR